MMTNDSGTGSRGALEGLKVLDLSFFAPGRAASLILGDLGADIVCVEMPRGVRPAESRLDSDTSSRWLYYQRNKKSITLNLKTPGGARVFRRLSEWADVIIESYKAGTAAKMGVDYETVRQYNPQVVYCSVSGFGQSGPYKEYIGHEPNYQGLSGILAHNHLDGVPPTMIPALVGDIGGGAMNGLIGILAALYHKQKTGEGQYIDVAIQSGILTLMGSLPYAQWLGEDYRATSFASGRRATFRPYATSDGQFVAISPSEPWLWERFCKAVGHEELAPLKNQDGEDPALVGHLEKLFASRSRQEWADLNDRENIAVTAVLNNVQEIENDPQIKHREVIVEVDYAPMGRVKQIKTPFKMSKTPPTVRWIPRYGEHTEKVLTDLGFSSDEIAGLRKEEACE